MPLVRRVAYAALPKPLLEAARRANAILYTSRFFIADWARFRRNYPIFERDVDQRSLEARITFHTHSLEKGLSHTKLRLGFGEAPIRALVEELSLYDARGYVKESRAYQIALSALRSYVDLHRGVVPAPSSLDVLPTWLMEELDGAGDGSEAVVHLSDSRYGDPDESFEGVLSRRHSVREFGTDPVCLNTLRRAVEMAGRAPSACNRQTARVRIVTDAELISRVKSLQGGLGGYPDPPVMLLVTSDVRDFLDPTERNQPFVDGGLFGMALLLSLERLHLAACPLHAMFSRPVEAEMRSLLDIADSELLVFFVAVGSIPHDVKVPASFRNSVDNTIVNGGRFFGAGQEG